MVNNSKYQQTKNIPTHLKSLSIKRPIYDVENPGPRVGHAQQCREVKPVNGIPTLFVY